MTSTHSPLDWLGEAFEKVGWFIPPFISLGPLHRIAGAIYEEGANYTQANLQADLAALYEPGALAAMVVERYPATLVIRDYALTISEAVEAHFLGLHHVAVGGLIPVIEGAGRRLAAERGIDNHKVKTVFGKLAASCRDEAIKKNLGATHEVIAMLNSFENFTTKLLYAEHTDYLLSDGTNRHGITHGHYADKDYGSPLNFYKTIAAIDFLTFVAAFRGGSWLGQSPSLRSMLLAKRWTAQSLARAKAIELVGA